MVTKEKLLEELEYTKTQLEIPDIEQAKLYLEIMIDEIKKEGITIEVTG